MPSEILRMTLFSFFSIFIAGADIKTGVVPRVAFVLAFPFFFVFSILSAGQNSLRESVIGMLLGLVIFLLAFIISKGKLGLADVWYSALTGMVLGSWWWYVSIGIACLTGIFFMIVTKRQKIPFIPFMALGSIAAGITQALF